MGLPMKCLQALKATSLTSAATVFYINTSSMVWKLFLQNLHIGDAADTRMGDSEELG